MIAQAHRSHPVVRDGIAWEDTACGGWGLWIANQACDLLQLRSLDGATVARLHMQLG